MNSERIIDDAIKETFKTKVEQKAWMLRFQDLLGDRELAKCELKVAQDRMTNVNTKMEGLFDMIGLNKLSKLEWRAKYIGEKIIKEETAKKLFKDSTVSEKNDNIPKRLGGD